MIRIVGFGSGMVGTEVDNLDEAEVENIEELVASGEPVAICSDLDDLERLGIDCDDIKMM